MKLASHITIGCKSLQLSLEVYEKLGFRKIKEDFSPNPWIQITDGSLLILLNEDGQEYIGLTYFTNQLDPLVKELSDSGIEFTTQKKQNDSIFMASFLTLEDFPITLINHNPDQLYKPQGISLATLSKEDFNNPSKYPNAKCGVFGEFTHFVKDLKQSFDFWKKIGYKPLSVNENPYPWAILSDGLNIIGLHQTSEFTHPVAITYFAPDMEGRIQKLKTQGLPIKGSSLITPENQLFLLFSL